MKLTTTELWFLLLRHDIDMVLGFANPVRGMLVQDILLLMERTTASLQDKGIIELSQDDILIRQDVAALLFVIASASSPLLCIRRTSDGEQVRSYYSSGLKIVEIAIDDGQTCTLSSITTRDAVVDSIIATFKYKMAFAPESPPIHLTHDTYEVMKNMEKFDYKQVSEIQTATVPEHVWEDLHQSMIHSTEGLVLLTDENDKLPDPVSLNGFSLFYSGAYLWCVEAASHSEYMYRASQVSKSQVKERILRMLS